MCLQKWVMLLPKWVLQDDSWLETWVTSGDAWVIAGKRVMGHFEENHDSFLCDVTRNMSHFRRRMNERYILVICNSHMYYLHVTWPTWMSLIHYDSFQETRESFQENESRVIFRWTMTHFKRTMTHSYVAWLISGDAWVIAGERVLSHLEEKYDSFLCDMTR